MDEWEERCATRAFVGGCVILVPVFVYCLYVIWATI